LFASISNIHALQVQDDIKIELSGFSLSEAFGIQDDLPFDIEQGNLIKLIYRLWQTSLDNLENYSQYTSNVSWDALLSDPTGYRLQVFEMKGRAQAVQKISLPESTEEPGFVYRISCVSEQEQPYEVLSLSIPRVWLDAQDLDQPISSLGFFYAMIKRREGERAVAANSLPLDDEPGTVPLFLAKQISWYPVVPNKTLGISADHILLADQNVDLALLDLIRQEDRKPLSSKDARPFYQFLEAVGNMGKVESQASESIDHMELLRNPQQSTGRRVSFRARVKKCSVVRPSVDATLPELAKGQYYQLMVFPDLRDDRDEPTLVEIGRGDEKLTYRRFPFTICCRQLPPGLNPNTIENQQIWIDGFYFRFWQYDAERTRSAGVAAQISPIIIANQPRMVELSELGLRRFFNGLLILLAVVLAIVGFTIFRFSNRSRTSKEQLPDKLDLDGLSGM
jgi:hypothetical protein